MWPPTVKVVEVLWTWHQLCGHRFDPWADLWIERILSFEHFRILLSCIQFGAVEMSYFRVNMNKSHMTYVLHAFDVFHSGPGTKTMLSITDDTSWKHHTLALTWAHVPGSKQQRTCCVSKWGPMERLVQRWEFCLLPSVFLRGMAQTANCHPSEQVASIEAAKFTSSSWQIPC